MSETVLLAGRLLALTSAGLVYLWLLGAALEPWLLPGAWRSYRWVAAPFLGWATLVAVAYPLNAALPGRPVLIVLGALAFIACVARVVRRQRGGPRGEPETALAVATGLLSLASPVTLYAGARAMSALVADSDVEHFADVIGALLAYPIGWSLEAQMGLEATPVGMAYHYVHAALSAVTGHDTFGTALPSHLVMASLAPCGVYLLAREALGAGPRLAAGAAALSAVGSFALGVSAFGWGQQTAALATVPAGLAGVRRALAGGGARDVVAGGLLAALATGSLYLATAPLMGGAAAVCALLLVRRTGASVAVGRLIGLGVVVLLAAALSHLSTVGFFLIGGLTGGDVSGRSTHVSEFASLAQALGVAPLTLFTVGVPPPSAVSTLAAGGALVVMFAGMMQVRREPLALAVLVTVLGFTLYLRVIRPFPYGEFKLLTSVWPLGPALAVVGTAALIARWPALRALWLACLVLGGAGMALTHQHVRAGLAQPWGAGLPEREMDALRQVVAGVPRGAGVWVSNQLVPEAAVTWNGVETETRHGLATREAGASYLAQRWRGAATALLALSGRPVYGLVQRHSTELRSPIDPSAADFLLLDESEDPLAFGLTETALVRSGGRLRLYRVSGGPLPPAHLPIGESLPGRRQGVTVPRVAPPAPVASGPAFFAHALWADAETEARLATPAGERRVALFPGLTWYVTRHAGLTLAPTDATEPRVVVRREPTPGAWSRGEQLVRSPAGILAPAALIADTVTARDVYYVNLSARLVSTAARPQRSDTVWLNGRDAAPQLFLDPPISRAQLPLQPGSATWLDIGPEGRAALHAPAGAGLFSLPLLGAPAERVPIENGTLVKGSSARLHVVLDDHLHWIPTLEALQRRGQIPRLVTLRDEDLWRLPVGLPVE